MKRNKIIIIIIAAVVIAGIGFGAGMMVKSATASGTQIAVDEAKQIALSSVGVSAGKATFTKAIFNEGVYEIDFYTTSNEYDFEVAADTGAIVDREVSQRDLSLPAGEDQTADNPGQDLAELSTNEAPSAQPASDSAAQENNDGEVIGVDSAKGIALNHAGISGVSFTKAYLDYDDGIRVYDIEFTAGNKEYDYEINAYTGTIIEHDIDYMDFDD